MRPKTALKFLLYFSLFLPKVVWASDGCFVLLSNTFKPTISELQFQKVHHFSVSLQNALELSPLEIKKQDLVLAVKKAKLSDSSPTLNLFEVRRLTAALLPVMMKDPSQPQNKDRLFNWFLKGLEPDQSKELTELFLRSSRFKTLIQEMISLGFVADPGMFEKWSFTVWGSLNRATQLKLWSLSRSVVMNLILLKIGFLNWHTFFIPSFTTRELLLNLTSPNPLRFKYQTSFWLTQATRADRGLYFIRKTLNAYVIATVALFGFENREIVEMAMRSVFVTEAEAAQFENKVYESDSAINEQFEQWRNSSDGQVASPTEIAEELVLFAIQEREGILRAYPSQDSSSLATAGISKNEALKLLNQIWYRSLKSPPTQIETAQMNHLLETYLNQEW